MIDRLNIILDTYRPNLTEVEPEELYGVTVTPESVGGHEKGRAIRAVMKNGYKKGSRDNPYIDLGELAETPPAILEIGRQIGPKTLSILQDIVREKAKEQRGS